MIKFFRHIRQSLIMENKTSKPAFAAGRYFKYAIGEIVLVVIGILIALSINNWNQERIQRSKSDELLRGITKDLSRDITTVNRMINYYQLRMNFFERLLPAEDFSGKSIDTLLKVIDSNAGSFYINEQSYQKVKNLGISEICSDNALSERIDNYYTRYLDYNKFIVQYDQNESVNYAKFWMVDQIEVEIDYPTDLKFPIVQDSLERRKNLLALMASPRGRNHIRMEVFRKELVLEHHYRIRENAETLRADIDAYLKQ